MSLLKSLIGICRSIPKIHLTTQQKVCHGLFDFKNTNILSNGFKTSSVRSDLMEFFEEKKNLPETNIQVGRAWKTDELRIKSNSDLHKLWYVLLKERNMLLTMEHECKTQVRLFPNPERIDKVKESMENLETVVSERNRAYHLLETGKSGEQESKMVYTPLGLKQLYHKTEHLIPMEMNDKWKKENVFKYKGKAVRKFLRLYKEKLYLEKRREKNKTIRHVMQLLKRFPNMDLEKLKAEYPDANVDKLKHMKKSQGNFIRDN